MFGQTDNKTIPLLVALKTCVGLPVSKVKRGDYDQ